MRLPVLLAAVSLTVILAYSRQDQGSIVSCEIRDEDWAISDWSAVRLGQLGISHVPAGDELHAYAFSTVPRPVPSQHVHSASPACDGNCYLVSAFDRGNTNELGGFFNALNRAPSTATAGLRRWEDGRRALTLDYVKTGSGFCGMWIHLFDLKRSPAERVYFDAEGYSFLTFWVRGFKGNERLLLKAADAQWERKEDALPVGDVGSFLPHGRIEEAWRQAVVPLVNLPNRLNRHELAVLVLEAVDNGDGKVAVKDLAFCRNSAPLVPLSPAPKTAAVPTQPEKALWIWNTAEILHQPEQQQALADFSRRNGFSHLFLQLPNDTAHLSPGGEIVLEPEPWKGFLKLLNQNGLHPYALDGFKNYALPEYHERVLKTVDNVVRYNQSVESGQRFHGIHYDIEPYLIPGFHGSRRGPILAGFLDLLEKMAARTRSAGMIIGVDIPFWYDLPDEVTGQVFLTEFKGMRRFASEHVIDLVDHIAIMDYRTYAYGADGIIGLAEAELAYASAKGKKVFVGLETGELPDEELIEIDGEPGRGLRENPPADTCVVVQPQPGKGMVWVVPRSRWTDFRRLLRNEDSLDSTLLWWPVRKTVHVPASKLTFARLGATRLQETMVEAVEELARYSSFAGYAVHDYLGYRRLLESSPRNSR